MTRYALRPRLASAGRAFAASAWGLLRDVVRWVRRVWSEAPIGHRIALLAILATGFGVRLWLLPGWPMRYDEAFTFLNCARNPLILGLTRYDMPNNHLFHTFLGSAGAHSTFGLSEERPG